MRIKAALYLGIAFAGAACIALTPGTAAAQQNPQGSVNVGPTDLGGVVTGRNGPEAGVWVIAETTDLPTRFRKIVVTDDRGRYVIPELPNATYHVWVRGYGLADSPKVDTKPGKLLNLTAVGAPTPAVAAQYYPPIYWFAMLRVPAKTEFPVGHVATQGAWLHTLKTGGCVGCHSLGSPGTRQVPKLFSTEFKDPTDAWTRRIQSGGAQSQMARDIGTLESSRALT